MIDKNAIATRRDLIQAGIGFAAAAAAPKWASAANPAQLASAPEPSPKMIGIQIGAISFVDEGVNKVLDVLQERGQVNTLFLSTFTDDVGTGGRQIKSRPLPDHGKQEYDDFHGGELRHTARAVLYRHSLQGYKSPGPWQP
jgi:hypothetical protein